MSDIEGKVTRVGATKRGQRRSFKSEADPIFIAAEIVADVPAKVRTNMRYRSIATLCLFGTTSIVALKYPYVGLGICCCCLIGYLKPDAPGTK